MTEPVSTEGDAPTPVAQAPASPSAVAGLWERIKHRKMVHWLAAYAAAAYTLLHGVEMISGGLAWPHLVVSLTTALVLLGAPVAAIIAWYHGERGLQRVSGMELAIFTVLAIIAGSVLWSMARNGGEPTATGTNGAAGVATQAAPTASSATAAAVQAATASAPRTALAVLPFSNLTGDASKEYLGDGMAEAMINTLTKVRGLKVPARTSTFAYKGRNADIRQIAKDLGVGTILEGSVQAAGKRIRITAQLINAQDGLHLWSETYDEEFTDIFKLQDKLATEIARALQPNLSETAAAMVAQAPPTQDVEAYALFLQGQSLVARNNAGSVASSFAFFRQAIARDPEFAQAYAGMADAHISTAVYLGSAVAENLAAAERYARQALSLDSSLANPHSELAGLSQFRRQFLEMEVHDVAALAREGNNAWSHSVRGLHLAVVGRVRAGLQEARAAYALAPADARVVTNLALLAGFAGLDSEAQKYADLGIGLGLAKETTRLAKAYSRLAMQRGQFDEAARLEIANLNLRNPEQAKTGEVIRLVYGAMASPAQRAMAIAARARLYPARPAGSIGTVSDIGPCLQSGLSYALIDSLDIAFSLVGQCLDGAAPGAVSATADKNSFWVAELRPFRLDKRFQAFVTRLGMMEYWQQYGPPDDCDLKDGKLTCH